MTRVKAFFARAAEGEYRPGPYWLTGGWLSASDGALMNWWQTGASLETGSSSALVHACVASYAETVAMCPGDHWRQTPLGGRERVENSALARLLRKPNAYESISDFLLNLTWQLYESGNVYILALRNDRFEPEELHLMSSNLSRPMVAQEGEIFYRLAGNDVINRQIGSEIYVPARDCLHIRLRSPQGQAPYPLVGQSPLAALYGELAIQKAIQESQGNFYANAARPSAVLSTDLVLDRVQTENLRSLWNEQTQALKAGNTPILTAGLKVQPWNVSSRDAQMAEFLKLSDERVCLAFRIPLQILGMGGGSPAGSTEALMRSWVSTGLGFALAHIEEGLGAFFRLRGQPYEFCEFSTEALLRSQYEARIDGLVKGVQGGVFSPNEARNQEGLDSVPFGDDVRVQAQNVPLSAAGEIPSAPSAPAAPSAPLKVFPNAVKDAGESLRRRLRDKRVH
jgi:HK97 family phage portal protein